MKKSNKKTPKSHLPKYERGGTGRAGADTTRTMYSGSEDAVMGNSIYQAPAQSGNSTDSVYNQGRQSKISAGQYAQAGSAIVGGGIQGYEAYSNPQANSLQKTRGLQSGVDSAEIGVAGAINPVLGMAVGAAKQIGSKAQTQLDKTDVNGNIINKSGSKAGEVVGGFMDPANSLIGIYSDPNATGGEKVAGALTGGLSDMFTNRHKNQVESSAKSNMFAGGGMNIQPNAEGNPTNNGNTGVNNPNLTPEMINYILNNMKKDMKYKRTIEDIPMKYKKEIKPLHSQTSFKKTLTDLPYNMQSIPVNLHQENPEPELKFGNGGIIHAPEMGGYFRKKNR